MVVHERTGDVTDLEDEIRRFMKRWSDAIESNDVAHMSQFVTEDWVLIDRPGMIPAEVFHAAVASGALRHMRRAAGGSGLR